MPESQIDWTIEPLNQKSKIAQEYGLLPADARQQKSNKKELPLREQWILNYVNLPACILLASDWFKNNQLLSKLTHAHYRDTVALTQSKYVFVSSNDNRNLRKYIIDFIVKLQMSFQTEQLRNTRPR